LEILIHAAGRSSPGLAHSGCELHRDFNAAGATTGSQCRARRFVSCRAEQGMPCQMLVVRVFSVLPEGAKRVSAPRTRLALPKPRDDIRFS